MRERGSADAFVRCEMELAVGIDLVDVDTFEESVRELGERYLRRIYTEGERHECCGTTPQLAARFAAKEAGIKALRPDGDAPPLRSVHSSRRTDGV
jgi:holo-[acyl-carrier protein] synthase